MAAPAKQKLKTECLAYLQQLDQATADNAADLLAKLAAQIQQEAAVDTSSVNQAALNVAFRVYYQIVHKFELEDVHFGQLPQQLCCEQPNAFLMLIAVLLTDHYALLNATQIEAKCIAVIVAALQQNSCSLVPALKATNQLVKKFPALELLPLQLEHFYQCLQKQSQASSREETLTLFNHCCKQRQRAFDYFRLIVDYWPWTNRNKYYLLSGILNSHELGALLADAQHNEREFFAGLRLSLSYKGLRAASQYPVKSLSSQASSGLLELAVELLVHGSVAEIQNFYSQWFLRIQQRDGLFQLLQNQPEIAEFLQNSECERANSEQYRLILIFSMFSKEIYAISKLHFFKISTELLTNCSCFETNAQLLIFKFLVDNLANFAVEDCLDFFYSFFERHRGVESSEFRNTLLGKMPTIINHTAKHYAKALKVSASDALASNIERFFRLLQQLVHEDMQSDVYQPKIFALKLLEILNKSLYAETVAKNAKMCSLQQNQQLGRYLLQRGVFQPAAVAAQLFKSLHDPQGFDDALELMVSLLLQLGHVSGEQCVARCLELCSSADVDECALVSLYARLAVPNFPSDEQAQQLYDTCLQDLHNKLRCFQQDPLHTAKVEQGHLFGHMCVLNELLVGACVSVAPDALLLLLERILTAIIDFFNLVNARQAQQAAVASFEDMEKSLQLLVSESSYQAADEDGACRKYLMMSFWLTLKACCDLASSLACLLLRSPVDSNCAALKRCLDINVAVLTRCRHKGAIEAAGLSVGRLTHAIASSVPSQDARFQLLLDCLERELLSDSRQVSTTRRGAGFSIMFLHVLKNDNPRQRLLLSRAMQLLLQRLQAATPRPESGSVHNSNHDRWEALSLHYLCVLVRDTELRGDMCKYYNEIMLVAMAHIDNAEWTISNAALQLFGALVPKLVGQRQATEFDTKLAWEPSELCYDELVCLLPKACEHMLRYCAEQDATSSIILFLGFLSKVEHLRTDLQPLDQQRQLLLGFRQLSWQLLRHKCEQVRQLAAAVFVRAHEFRCDLPTALLASAELSAQVNRDNHYVGLLHTLHAGVLKLQHEARHVWSAEQLHGLQQQLLSQLQLTPELLSRYKAYTLQVLLALLELLEAGESAEQVRKLLGASTDLNEAALAALTLA